MSKFVKVVAAIMLIAATMAFAVGCNKQEENPDNDVKVTTYAPQDITYTSAKCGGDAVVAQGLSLSSIGVCWSTEHSPTAEDYCETSSNWNEPFVCTIEGLNPGTTYHIRAFAVRGLLYYYGEELSFTTEEYNGVGEVDGHESVDLGLQSGLLWAICNCGTSSPEGYGTQGNQTESGNPAVVWGSGWRQPTLEEWEELCQNTSNHWATQNGVNGWLFTASNGRSLFLPAAGNHYDQEEGVSGYYWSSTISDPYNPYATPNAHVWGLKFTADGCEIVSMYRGSYYNFRLVHSPIQ